MGDALLYQIRIQLPPEMAEVARNHPDDSRLDLLQAVLTKHNARMKCQLDAFLDYVSEAEANGVDHYPLYRWTKETVKDPLKQAKHSQVFTLYVDGNEVYEKGLADALENDLTPLRNQAIISAISKYDTNPANNPQPPAHPTESR